MKTNCKKCIHWKKWKNVVKKQLEWCDEYTCPDVFQYCSYFRRKDNEKNTD